MRINLLSSKTVIGAIIAALGKLLEIPELQQYGDIIGALSVVLQGVGLLIGAIGVRTAIAKASQGVAQLHFGTVIGALMLLAPAIPLPGPDWTLAIPEGSGYCDTRTSPMNCFGAAGDSLRYVIMWKQPPDTATKGKVDSTFYRLTSSKGVTFYGSTGLTVPNTPVRRKFTTGLADSLKLVKPALGDSATFQITGFVQCRKGDCSVPGSAAWKYRETFAPPPATPTIRIETF